MVSRADFLCKKMLAEIFLSLGKMHLGFFFFFLILQELCCSHILEQEMQQKSFLKAATGINKKPLCQYLGMQIHVIKS